MQWLVGIRLTLTAVSPSLAISPLTRALLMQPIQVLLINNSFIVTTLLFIRTLCLTLNTQAPYFSNLGSISWHVTLCYISVAIDAVPLTQTNATILNQIVFSCTKWSSFFRFIWKYNELLNLKLWVIKISQITLSVWYMKPNWWSLAGAMFVWVCSCWCFPF